MAKIDSEGIDKSVICGKLIIALASIISNLIQQGILIRKIHKIEPTGSIEYM